jgi:hypothetical protein
LPVDLALSAKGKEIEVKIAAGEAVDATLWLLSVAPSLTQDIKRGENAGETITYTNVVRNMVPAAMWKGEAFSGKWMKDAVMTADGSVCVAILQREKTGSVLGIAQA